MSFVEMKDLEIMQLAEAISDVIWHHVKNWEILAKRTVGEQIIKAADSIGANIAESQGRIHVNDAIRFLYISRGSLVELQYWLQRVDKRGLMSKSICMDLDQKVEKLYIKLNAFIRGKSRWNSSHQAISDNKSSKAIKPSEVK